MLSTGTRPAAAPPPSRRRLEPLDEGPPTRAPAARKPAERPRRNFKPLVLVLVILALIGAGIAVIASQSGDRQIQLREQVDGNVEQAIEELRGLIDDNTR